MRRGALLLGVLTVGCGRDGGERVAAHAPAPLVAPADAALPAPAPRLATAREAPEAHGAPASVARPPRVRGHARLFGAGLAVDAHAAYYFELASAAEARRPMSDARWRWMRLPLAAGPPRVVADALQVPAAQFAIDDANVYWASGNRAGITAMALAGGEIRSLATQPRGARVAVGAGAVCFVSEALHDDGLWRVSVGGGPVAKVADVPGGAPRPVVVGEGVYWYDHDASCIVGAPLAGGPITPAFCDGVLTGVLASDGVRLYGATSGCADAGCRTQVFALEPTTGALTVLHEFEAPLAGLSARDDRVVGLLARSGAGDDVVLIERDGRATILATGQRKAAHVVLAADRALWTRAVGERDEIVEQLLP